jgi:hypothetical protein
MKRTANVGLVLLCTLTIVNSMSAGIPDVQANDEIDLRVGLRRAYEERQKQIRSVMVTYTMKTDNLIDMKVLSKARVADYLVDEKLIEAYDGRRAYHKEYNYHSVKLGPGTFPERELIFDGEKCFEKRPDTRISDPTSGKPRRERTKVSRDDPDQVLIDDIGTLKYRRFLSFYLSLAGCSYIDPTQPKIDAQNDSDNILLLMSRYEKNMKLSKESIDGSECVLVDFDGHQKIWFDPALDFAVRRRELFGEQGMLESIIVMGEFKEVINKMHLPYQVVSYTIGDNRFPAEHRGNKVLRRDLSIIALALNDPAIEKLFEPNIVGGAYVLDATNKPTNGSHEYIIYRQPADKKDLKRVVTVAKEMAERSTENRYKSKAIIILVNVAMLFGFILVVIMKGKTQKPDRTG